MELVSSDDDDNKDGERDVNSLADGSFAVSIDEKKDEEEGSSKQEVGWGAAIAGAAAATARVGMGLFGLGSPAAGGSPLFKRGARNPFVSGASLVFGMDDDERDAEDEEGGVTMDVTKCVGGIQGIDDVEDDEEVEGEMELTRAVGGIRGVLRVSGDEGNELEEEEDDDEEEEMGAMTMELTKAVGGIKELLSRTDLTFDRVEDEDEEDQAEQEEMTMDVTKVVGGIRENKMSEQLVVDKVVTPIKARSK